MPDHETVTIRFVLNLPTEDLATLDVAFADARQARRAINAVLGANGPLVSVKNATNIPVLIRSADVSAAFPVDYESQDDDEDEDEDADDESASDEE